jgi:hypothetical protein
MFLTKRLPGQVVCDFYAAAERWFGRPTEHGKLAFVQKRIINLPSGARPRSHKDVHMIEDFCAAQVKQGFVTPALLDAYVAVCGRTHGYHGFFEALYEWLSGGVGPAAIFALEQMALQALAADPEAVEAARVVPETSYFFGLFNAVLAVEKKSRAMRHEDLLRKLAGVHRRALELVNDTKFRFFAPLYALFEDPVDVPGELEAFLDQNRDRMQASYETESAHEW